MVVRIRLTNFNVENLFNRYAFFDVPWDQHNYERFIAATGVVADALHRHMAILAGLDVLENLAKCKQLVLWTIACFGGRYWNKSSARISTTLKVVLGSKPLNITEQKISTN